MPATAKNSRHLVAPELLGGLDIYPDIDISDAGIAMLRAGGAAIRPRPLSAEQQGVECEERHIPGPPGAPPVRILVYTSATRSARSPAYLHMHGGGYVLGSAEISDGANRTIAVEQDALVVSVDYRLAPETRWPGALEDGYAALLWLHEQAEALGIDPARIAIGGESAGGGHAAALALLARDRGGPAIALQFLDSPMLDDRTGSGAEEHPFCGEFGWQSEKNRLGWRALLGVEPGSADVPAAAVPARIADLSGLPPTFLTIGALDLFLEETLDYARRLIRAGVPAELHVIPGAYHGFPIGGAETPQNMALGHYRRAALARAFSINEGETR